MAHRNFAVRRQGATLFAKGSPRRRGLRNARAVALGVAPGGLVSSTVALGVMALGALALGLAALTIPLEAAAEGRPAAAPAGSAEAATDAAQPTARDLPFTRENVLQVVRDHGEQLQGCYEDAMARRGATSKDAPAGRVVMSWTITLQGLAADVKVKTTQIKDSLVTECIAEAIRFWQFPKPANPQPVEFPFDLKPVGGKKPASTKKK